VKDYQKGEGGETGGGGLEALCAQTFIPSIATEVENDRRKSLSGSLVDNETYSPTLNKDLKLSKKSARGVAPTQGQGDEEASLDMQGARSDFYFCFFTILDNNLTVGE
jgi:hypothetical protein